jgi:hypothetical protein
MATPTNPNLFVDESSAAPSPNVISVQTNTNDTKTLIANYNDPALYATPLLQIRNDVGGSKGQIQFHNGTTFGGSSNLTFDANVANVSKLSLRGDMYIYGNLVANINTNLNNLRITGGLGNQILATDGTGNLHWVSYDPNIASGIFNGNSNVIVYPNADIRFSSNNVPNVVIVNSSGIRSANLTVTGNSNLGANSNVKLAGGLPGQFLKTDGYGNLSWDQPAGIYMSETAPFVGEGNVWFNTDEGRAYVSYDGTWVDMSPAIMPNPDLYANTITFPDGSVQTTASGGGGGGGNSISNGGSNITIPSANGNILINPYGTATYERWKFDTDGNITTTNGVAKIIHTNDGGIGIRSAATAKPSLSYAGSLIDDPDTSNIVVGSNIVITTDTGNKIWNFDSSGGLTLPENTYIIGTTDYGIESAVNGYTSGIYFNGNHVGGTTIVYSTNDAMIRSDNNGTFKDWTFGKNGNIIFPGGTTTLGEAVGSGFALNTTSDITILKDGLSGFEVRGASSKIYSNNTSWNFNDQTGLTFPDSTVQTTAFTGAIAGASVTGQVGNSVKAGTVYTNAQPNITSLGTLTSVSVSGNVNTSANVNAAYFIGNGSSLTGIVATVAQTVSASSQSNITSVGTLTNLVVAGNVNVEGTTDTGGPTSGALKTAGGLGVAKSASIGNDLFVGPGAALTAFTNPTIIAKDTGSDYIQAALVNASDTGSSDWVAYGDNGTDNGGWVDMGFTSSAYNDANFTVTGPNDGYVFAQAQSASGLGGNLVLATGSQGTTNDIIFATGGFLTENIFGKIVDATQTLDIPAGSANIGGNLHIGGTANIDGNAKFSSNVLITHDLQVNGNINFNGDVTQISGVSGQFFGDANGIGALYAGVSTGYSVVANPVIQAATNVNDYTQINFQNLNGGNTSSTEYAATADNGNDNINYIDFGIAGGSWDGTQTNSVGDAAHADDGWVYVQGGTGGGNLILGATSTNKSVKILTGGAGNANIRAKFYDSGLSVVGNVIAAYLRGDGSNISNVPAANVSGLGNISTINLNGSSSQVLYGNGVFAAAGGSSSYGNSNVATYLASYGSNTITTTGNVSVGNIIATNIGNAAAINLTGSTSNVLYGNGVFAPITSSYGDSNVATLLGAFGSNNVSTTGNITANNMTASGNISLAGNIYSGLGGSKGFVLGNVNSRFMAVGSNAYITLAQNIMLQPDNAAYAGAGVQVGGSGYLLAPNGSRVITLGNDGSLSTNGDIKGFGNANISGSLTRSGSITTLAWGSSGIGLKLASATYTDTSTAAGTLAAQYIHSIGAPTYAFSNAVTLTNAATLYVNSPTAGANATFTNSWAIYTNGNVGVLGNLTVSGSGAITMPNRPAFRVVGTGGQIASVTTITSANWTQDFQQGTALDGTTGIFTAPLAGLYQVNLVVRCYTNSGPSAQVICRKTTAIGSVVTTAIMVEWASNTTMNHTGGSTIIKLAVGDTLKVDVALGSISFDQNDNWSVAFIG